MPTRLCSEVPALWHPHDCAAAPFRQTMDYMDEMDGMDDMDGVRSNDRTGAADAQWLKSRSYRSMVAIAS
jgi:hypothetical protein